jgi:hypothetical protein
MWLALFAPLLLLTGRGWPSALALVGGAVWTAWEYARARHYWIEPHLARSIWHAFVVALPVMFAPLAAWLGARSGRDDFWERLEQLALAYAVAGGSLACSYASMGAWSGFDDALVSVLTGDAVLIVAGAGVALARPGLSGRMSGAIIAGAASVMLLAFGVNDLTVPAAILFFALCTGIAVAALAAQWRRVFQLAVGVIAVRLIILSFELAGDLLMNGLGLILAGLMILGVAWVAVRVSKRFAPPAESAA